VATSKRISKVLENVEQGGLLTRIAKVFMWLTVGKLDDQQKAVIVTFLEKAKDEAKNIQITANKNGEVSLKYKKEI
jgi:hypothetical protein